MENHKNDGRDSSNINIVQVTAGNEQSDFTSKFRNGWKKSEDDKPVEYLDPKEHKFDLETL